VKLQGEITSAILLVLRSPMRRRMLLRDPRTFFDLMQFLVRIVPLARNEIVAIRKHAQRIPDIALREQALSSIDAKSYHVAGAAILATFLPRRAAREYIRIVAPLESIYDYLDNLCDRHAHVAHEAYPVLHQAIADACNPDSPGRNYYALGPMGDDGGYLRDLVLTVQQRLRAIPNFEALLPTFRVAAELYARMQSSVHAPAEDRERLCRAWFEEHRSSFPDLTWNEFVAAAGSQFQVYAPLYSLLRGTPAEIEQVFHAHFPAVASLHVLLDSFIDRQEDREHGDLNLVASMPDRARILERFAFLAGKAEAAISLLSDARPHRFLLQIMTLFYLSHPKIAEQGLEEQAIALLATLERSGFAEAS